MLGALGKTGGDAKSNFSFTSECALALFKQLRFYILAEGMRCRYIF